MQNRTRYPQNPDSGPHADSPALGKCACFSTPLLITLPEFVSGEVEAICALLGAGVRRMHVRKPSATPAQLEALLEALAAGGACMACLTLHPPRWEKEAGSGATTGVASVLRSTLELARKYAVGGVHLPLRVVVREDDLDNLVDPDDVAIFEIVYNQLNIVDSTAAHLRLSTSAHSWAEVDRAAPRVDYCFMSPLYDSISKQGYRSAITPHEARQHLLPAHPGRVIALGGISPENIATVRGMGFDGAAVLGAVWAFEENPAAAPRLDAAQTVERYAVLARRERASRGELQFISDGDLAVAESFLRGGGRWVQLRMKESPEEAIIARGIEMLALCRRYGALLIVNDHPHLLPLIGADGVHLGQGDMPVARARVLVGPRAIIGSTCNDFAQIRSLASLPPHEAPDYVGLGPFRHTTTKKNLSPLLGLAGYTRILGEMRAAGIHTPVVAIGGIEFSDVPQLLSCGVNGIAMSGAIARAVHSGTPWRVEGDAPVEVL